ncbi:hypothetical protein B0H11DRAFT_2242108 [Mycena galericulata]|nr:hypothetical protein B0H11DRAFT_2242108 [Mycena galericulata]
MTPPSPKATRSLRRTTTSDGSPSRVRHTIPRHASTSAIVPVTPTAKIAQLMLATRHPSPPYLLLPIHARARALLSLYLWNAWDGQDRPDQLHTLGVGQVKVITINLPRGRSERLLSPTAEHQGAVRKFGGGGATDGDSDNDGGHRWIVNHFAQEFKRTLTVD